MPPTDPAQAAATLRELLAQYGAGLADDPRRCAALFRDVWPEGGPHVAVLLGAVEEQVPGELMRSSTPIGPRIEQLTARLVQQRGLSADMADWAVRTWAVALGSAAASPPRPGPPPGPGPGQRPRGPQGPPDGGVGSTQVPPPQQPRPPEQPGHWGGDWGQQRQPDEPPPRRPVGLLAALAVLSLVAIGVIAYAILGPDPEIATDTTTPVVDTTSTSRTTTTTRTTAAPRPSWNPSVVEQELLNHVVGDPPRFPRCMQETALPTGANGAISCTAEAYTTAWLYKFGSDGAQSADYTARVQQSGVPFNTGSNDTCRTTSCERDWIFTSDPGRPIGRRLVHGNAAGAWLVFTLDDPNITIVAFRKDGNKNIVFDLWNTSGGFEK